MWRFRGTPHYLDQQANRLGVAPAVSDKARHIPELYRVSVLVGHLCEVYHRSPKDGDRAVLRDSDAAQARSTLAQCEIELAKLHCAAAATAAILDEAARALGIEPTVRHYRVQCDFDDLPSGADLAAGYSVPSLSRSADMAMKAR